MVMGNYKNLCVFNFTILVNLQKSRKFDAREIYVCYSSLPNHVVHAESTNIFKTRLHKFRNNQDILYNYHAEIQGTESRIIINK